MRLVESQDWRSYCQGQTVVERAPFMRHFHATASPADIDDVITKVTEGSDLEAIGAMFLLIDLMYLRDRRFDHDKLTRWLDVCQGIVDGAMTSFSLWGLATSAIRTSGLKAELMDRLRDGTIASRGYTLQES